MNYLNDLLCECAPENGFAQDAIEHAIVSGSVTLTMDHPEDVKQIMSNYDTIIESYRNRGARASRPLRSASPPNALQLTRQPKKAAA